VTATHPVLPVVGLALYDVALTDERLPFNELEASRPTPLCPLADTMREEDMKARSSGDVDGQEARARPKQLSMRRTAVAAMGNMLEYYDFSVAGFFTKEIGANFFPASTAGMAAIQVT
jgi:hypothetical protein